METTPSPDSVQWFVAPTMVDLPHCITDWAHLTMHPKTILALPLRAALAACLLALAACGGGSSGSGATPPVVVTPAPTVSISASPATVAAGASSTLTWSSTDATSCTASGAWSGTQATSGSTSVTATATGTYSLSCTGAGGSAQSGATVTVAAAAAPSVSFSASPASVAAGATSTLTWSSTNATSCTASGGWSGTKATSGTYTTPALNAGASYTLACTGAGGTASKSANVTIQASGAPTSASASTLGPLAVVKYSSGIVVPTGARFQQPTIWYPSGGTGPYPGVVFVPGYTSDYLNPKAPLDETDVIQWATFLASHGFVVMFVNSKNIAADGPPEKMNALLDGVEAFAAESTRGGSPIAGLLQAQNIAVMGHSFGAAAALFAANAGTNARIQAVVALSPVPNNSSFGPYPNDTVPSLIMAGQGDPLYSGFQGEYNSIPGTTTKLLAIFNQANTGYSTMHNVARNPLGAHISDPAVARYGLSFLEVYLAGDARYQQFLVNDALLQVFAYNP